ncbi:MAG TPA: acyltransferase [Longimicrobiaceae bacterium]|nr:acyltransferase [Longimicrobiaceae bacterium]
MPELDSIRGIAVLMVVVYHAFFWSNQSPAYSGFTRALLKATQPGWLGVQLFFVLSGFLITGILCDTRERTDYFQRFYSRRALRILPAYFAMLAVLATLHIAQLPFLIASAAFQNTPWELLFVGGIGAALVVGSSERSHLVQSKVLAFFGWISYGLYLCHLLIFQGYDALMAKWFPEIAAEPRSLALILLRFVAAGGGAVVISCISRAYFEEWFLRLRGRVLVRANDSHNGSMSGEPASAEAAPRKGTPAVPTG